MLCWKFSLISQFSFNINLYFYTYSYSHSFSYDKTEKITKYLIYFKFLNTTRFKLFPQFSLIMFCWNFSQIFQLSHLTVIISSHIYIYSYSWEVYQIFFIYLTFFNAPLFQLFPELNKFIPLFAADLSPVTFCGRNWLIIWRFCNDFRLLLPRVKFNLPSLPTVGSISTAICDNRVLRHSS